MEDCENFGCEKLEAFAESDDDEEILEDPSQLNDVQEIETVYNKQDENMMRLEKEKEDLLLQIKELKREKMELKNKMNILTLEKYDHDAEVEAHTKEKNGLLAQLEAELRGRDALNKKLTDAVTCSVCLNVPRGNRIPVCNNGHIYCSECKQQERFGLRGGLRCPVCREYSWEERYSQIALNVSDLLDIDCVNQVLGCKAKLPKSFLIEHEENCVYAQNLDCPNARSGCRVKVSYTDCIEHLTKTCTFGDELRTVELGKPKSYRLTYDGEELYEHCAITAIVKGTSDYVIVTGDMQDDYVMIAIKCLSPDRTSRYKVEMKLVDKVTKQSKTNLGETLLMTEDMDLGIEAGNVLEINSRTYRRYLDGECKFYFTLRKPVEAETEKANDNESSDEEFNPYIHDKKLDKSRSEDEDESDEDFDYGRTFGLLRRERDPPTVHSSRISYLLGRTEPLAGPSRPGPSTSRASRWDEDEDISPARAAVRRIISSARASRQHSEFSEEHDEPHVPRLSRRIIVNKRELEDIEEENNKRRK